ncbi:hypothetical protein ACE5IS_12780 [Leptospira wolffii]|uniref:Pentapeptide MXKDX repeat protein n=1 Tax=Leptospira wolffii TaxID=409998 RepID=A0ABV5BQ68_9LEPT|nr:hypothetical protein [Leptospira wolffii]TGL53783.1 hypothetical protein EHQ61_03810 [Leptospira wolffii]
MRKILTILLGIGIWVSSAVYAGDQTKEHEHGKDHHKEHGTSKDHEHHKGNKPEKEKGHDHEKHKEAEKKK